MMSDEDEELFVSLAIRGAKIGQECIKWTETERKEFLDAVEALQPALCRLLDRVDGEQVPVEVLAEFLTAALLTGYFVGKKCGVDVPNVIKRAFGE